MSVASNTPLAILANSHDMALETRKRDGKWIATPVHPVVEGDHVFFRTWHTSGKAKRLRNFHEVRFAPSTARGRPTGPWLRGRATLLDGVDAAHAADLINRRYPLLQGVAVRLYHRVRGYRTLHYRISDITVAEHSDAVLSERSRAQR
jgi:PPOX class probable F420-dependent enzyme